ncbi:flavin reductase [Micromonospora sp. WMMD998]|uniref:flavin reductase n=1 Tax=Micromonospora sp. WMMD998 TaxID=3016092 RepID=UPI00249B0889|nr:flavin reductase [Micromonospora sp. WMMD998]WFE42251.1 flavin reductase [Micromonospora sp. WMMD998]
MQRHAPLKPLWICTACAHPWPCGPARLELTAEYAGEPQYLALDMAGLLNEATEDMTGLCPAPPDPLALYGRFLGWVRHLTVYRSRIRNLGHIEP